MTDPLDLLREGIRLEERGIVVPWLIDEDTFLTMAGVDAPRRSEGGGWPLVAETVFGVRADFAFNFVSVENRLSGAERRWKGDARRLRRQFRRMGRQLIATLGRPRTEARPRYRGTWQRMKAALWQRGPIWIELALCDRRRDGERGLSLVVWYRTAPL
jgi:hypothetical protein